MTLEHCFVAGGEDEVGQLGRLRTSRWCGSYPGYSQPNLGSITNDCTAPARCDGRRATKTTAHVGAGKPYLTLSEAWLAAKVAVEHRHHKRVNRSIGNVISPKTDCHRKLEGGPGASRVELLCLYRRHRELCARERQALAVPQCRC